MHMSLHWPDWCFNLCNRWLASPAFQRWAAAFPLTRPIARRRTRALFDLCAGFVYSQVLLACVRLRLLDILYERPHTTSALAARLSLSTEATARLLNAAASLQLVKRRSHGRFGIGPLGAALVGNPGIAAMVEHHTLLYADLRDPVALLRGERDDTGLGGYWPYAAAADPAALPDERVREYSALMSASQPFIAREILAVYPFAKHRCLLDAGGGDGTFLCAVAEQYPELQLMLFDLPAVAARAQDRFARAGLQQRASATGGSLLSDPLPEGADIVSLVRVIHDHDDDTVLRILRAVHRALPAGGTLLLAEPMAGTAGAEPVGDAYFGFYLLAMGKGRARTLGELHELLSRAGFGRIRPVATRTPLLTGMLLAEPLPTGS